jgi:SET domain-containing protein
MQSSKIHRKGVFARHPIAKDEIIAIWGGHVIPSDKLGKLPKYILTYSYPVQISEEFYLGPKTSKDLDDSEMFNHSCNPNAGIKGQVVLVARRSIRAGEEICFDYETTDTRGLDFICNCGEKCCRRTIDGSSWKNPRFQAKNKGYLSLYIQEKLGRQR